MAEEMKTYALGEHTKIDDITYLVVRYCDSATLFEEAETGSVWVEHEQYVELRGEDGQVRFVQISTSRAPGKRVPGRIRGIKPYFWKVK